VIPRLVTRLLGLGRFRRMGAEFYETGADFDHAEAEELGLCRGT
jgi:hypothetical protein